MFSSTPGTASKFSNRLVRTLRSPEQMALLPISSRTQPVQHSNTESSKLTPQSLTHLHTDWQQCQTTAVQVWTINATIGTKRWLSPKKQMLPLLTDPQLCTATTGELLSFCAYLINTETPVWNCTQNRCTLSLSRFQILYQNCARFILC